MPRLDYREQFICLISASLLPIFEVSFSIYEYIIMVSRFALTLGAIVRQGGVNSDPAFRSGNMSVKR